MPPSTSRDIRAQTPERVRVRAQWRMPAARWRTAAKIQAPSEPATSLSRQQSVRQPMSENVRAGAPPPAPRHYGKVLDRDVRSTQATGMKQSVTEFVHRLREAAVQSNHDALD